MSIVKKTVSLEEIKGFLAEGKTRKEIAEYYGLPLSAMAKSVFQHPELKSKKSKKIYEIVLAEDMPENVSLEAPHSPLAEEVITQESVSEDTQQDSQDVTESVVETNAGSETW
jgi:hypothetical protein